MKLNPDCIRDILLTVEEKLGYRQVMKYNTNTSSEFERLTKYDYEEVLYHASQAHLSNLLIGTTFFMSRSDGFHVSDLSPKGHEFLANIRAESNWNKTKEIAKSVGSFSLDALTKIAIGVITSAINKQL